MTKIWDQLYAAFATITDPRIERTKAHSLIDIISMAMCAVICGADSWVAVATFGTTKRAWLERALALPNGIPAHDPFGCGFAALDATQFQEHVVRWVQTIWSAELGEVSSIDGQPVCGSHDRGIGKHASHMVSAWAHQSRLVLAQPTVDAKSNEITAIPALVRLLALHGCTVAIDAMGTQPAIARQRVTQGGAYALAVTANQEPLHTAIADPLRSVAADQWQRVAHEHTWSVEAGHGRSETRDYGLITEPSYLAYITPKSVWRDVGGSGMVVRERTLAGQTRQETGEYLLSGTPTARSCAGAVRGHWGSENCVHWGLDVTCGEDGRRIRSGDAPQHVAVVRHIALNLLRREARAGRIATKRFRAALDERYLLEVLRA